MAEEFDTAKNATPTPGEFDAARQEALAAQARRDPIGVAQAARKYADLHARAVDAAMTYHGGATSAVNRLGTPLQTAPAIARGGPAIQPVDAYGEPGHFGPGGEHEEGPPVEEPGGPSVDPDTGAREITGGGAPVGEGPFGEGGKPGGGGGGRIVAPNVKTISEVPLQSDRLQIERKFLHAADFGVTDPRGRVGFDNFARALEQEVNDPETIHINGTYRGDPAILNYNPNSGLCVIETPDGKFVSGWKLSDSQINNVVSQGKLGGGD
jgi:Colicin D